MRGKIRTLEGSGGLNYAASYPKQGKKDEAEDIKKQLEEAGASVTLK